MVRRGGFATEGVARRCGGYNLVLLIMVLTVLNIMIAAALPLWSHAAKRQKEEELIFRGLQYAEAIRVFQQRHGRLPVKLKELVEVEPRSIRQLWEDPMSESGEWGLLIQGAPRQQAGRQQNRGGGRQPKQGANQPNRGANQPGQVWDQVRARLEQRGRGGRGGQGQGVVAIPPGSGEDGGRRVTTGPIVGVYSASGEEAAKTFFGATSYSEWRFTVDIIRMPALVPGDGRVLRASSDWIGRPFRDGLQPNIQVGNAGQELTSGDARRGRRGKEDRRRGRRSRRGQQR